MRTEETPLPGLLILEPRRFADGRGWFTESWNRRAFEEATGVRADFVQDNHSASARGVLRGLHYQVSPSAQGKLVRVLRGEVYDVAVDIREGSPTYGRWAGFRLSEANRLQLWVPAGFAHGFLALTDGAEVAYKATAFYDPACERSIIWNDPDLAIEWPLDALAAPPLLAPKDAAAPPFSECEPYRAPARR